MYEDLQPLAALRINKATEQFTQEMQRQVAETNLSLTAKGSVLTGGAEMQKFNIRAAALENICQTIANTWSELITKRNHSLTRDDLTFIMQQVESYAFTQAKHLGSAMINVPGGPVVTGNYWIEQADTKMRRVAGDIRRDLEIRYREQEAFPSAPPASTAPMPSPVQVHVESANIANLNLGTQVGTINAALQLLSSEGEDRQAVAEALKQLTEAVIVDRHLKEHQKQEAVEALSVLANEAETGKTSITTKALVAWLPQLIGLSADLLTLWDKAGPTIRAFFHF
jgi:hypothetical protein